MWLKCINHMVDYYSKLAAFENILVQGGTNGRRPEKMPAVLILRNVEAGIDYHRQAKGEISLWIELWVRNDSKSPIDAYTDLNTLENLYLTAFSDWTKALCDDLGIAAKVTIPHFVGDAERVRPLCGSQSTVNIEWKTSIVK